MSEKKFTDLSGAALSSPELDADFDSAERFDRLRVGARGVYFREGFKTRFLDYTKLERVFIRVQGVNGRMCCATANFEYYKLVFVSGGREVAEVFSESEKATDAALARIAELAPALAIGVGG